MTKRARRTKSSPGARLRPFWFAAVFLLAGVCAGAYYAAVWPGFYPRHVSVRGNHVVPVQEIVSHAQIAAHTNLWLQNMRAASARIEAIPYISRAWVHRTLPASVRIDVTERTPLAIVSFADGAGVVDADLRVLKPAVQGATLPVFAAPMLSAPQSGSYIKDERVRRLRDDYEALLDAHVVVRSLAYDKYGDLQGELAGRIKLLLGDDSDLQSKSALVAPILSQVAAGGKRIAALDLRAPKTPVVVYR